MLKAIRKNARVFLYVLITAFVMWLAYDVIISAQRAPYAGKIFGRNILINDYQKSFDAVKTKAIFAYGDKFRQVAKDLRLKEEAWDRLILLHEAKRQRIKTTDKEVSDFIKDIAVFKDKNGNFDMKAYEYILRYTFRLTPREFEEQVRDDLNINKLIDKQSQKVTLTDDEVLREYKVLNEQAKASYILFKVEDYLSGVKNTEEEVKSYFEKNKKNYMIPEQVNVEYFGKAFPDEKDETKDKIRKEIKEISYEFAASKDFEGIAKKFSLPIKETGFFDEQTKIPEIGWALNLAQAALSLKPQEVSNPIETKTGIYILRVKGKKPAHQAEFNEVRDKVGKNLATEKAAELASQKAKEALAAIKTGLEKNEKFEAIAKSFSLSVKESGAFSRQSYIEGLGAAPEFVNAAFSVKEGEVFGEPVKVHKGFAIVKLDSIIPIDENKLKEEKEKFKEQLLLQKKYLNFIGWFFELKKEANLKSNIELEKPEF